MEKVPLADFVNALREKGRDADVFPEGVTLVENVPFLNTPSGELLLDIYDREQAPSASRPALLFVHGGGWRVRGKEHFWAQAAYLAFRYGLLSVCIEYRPSHEACFPAAIQDVKCAIRWLRSKASELLVDPERVAVAGGSSGGHLAALAATDGGRLGI